MQGATVVLEAARWGNKLTVTATSTATNGEQWIETFTADDFADSSESLGLWFTVDHSCLAFDINKTTITDTPEPPTTAIEAVKDVKPATGVRYNVAGQQVGSGFRGLVIENGRKFMVK